MTHFNIKQGYRVPITGEARLEVVDGPKTPFIGVSPVEFAGLKPKLAVKVDDEVKVGSLLFFAKKQTDLKFLSPASGRVTAINYGPRRVIESVVIATSNKDEYESFTAYKKDKISGIGRDKLISELMAGGMWPYIRQRPFSKIADPEASPKAIFVNAMGTAPLANDPNFSLKDSGDAFAAGVEALKVLCNKVHVCTRPDQTAPIFKEPSGVEHHTFAGKHPAGLTGTHVSRVDPINKGDAVWYLSAADAVMIGSFLLEGRYPTERIVAVAGPGVANPRYVRTRSGAKIKDLVSGNLNEGEQRFVSGDVLSGSKKDEDHFLGFYDSLLSVLPEGRDPHFLGWMRPGHDIPSYSRVYISGFLGKLFNMNTNLNGGHRAIIQSGTWEKVVALDVFPEHLVKVTLVQDVEAMERLGILECDPEDFALATYLCPSKTEVSKIIAEGLDLMEKDG